MKSVKDYIISIPDFPSKGIIFRDVTSVLESPEGYALAIDAVSYTHLTLPTTSRV